MGLISRFTTYIKTVFSSALDKAEDPGMTLDYSYQKQLEQLQNLRREAIRHPAVGVLCRKDSLFLGAIDAFEPIKDQWRAEAGRYDCVKQR